MEGHILFLITGFEPFISVEDVKLDVNPTKNIAHAVASTSSDIESRILPVSFERTRTDFLRALKDVRPQVWIGLGYAPHRTSIDVESIALNLEYSTRPDNDGVQPDGRPIIPKAPLALATNLDVNVGVKHLDGCGAQARRWTHAGTFLCNQVFFLGCEAQVSGGPPNYAVFIHIPPMDSYGALERGLCDWISSIRVDIQ